MIARVISYSFTPSTRRITLKDVQTVDISKVQYIINLTRGNTLYDYSIPAIGTISLVENNIVQISHSTAGMLYTDELAITYDFPEASGSSEVIVNNYLGTSSSIKKDYIAGETINGGKAVMMDSDALIYVFDINNSSHFGKCIGVAEQSVISGDLCTIVGQGVSSLIGSGWTAGSKYYISSTGFLSSTSPILGWCQIVAIGVDTNIISVQLQLGIELI